MMSLPALDKILVDKFGQEWVELEDETLAFETNTLFSELLLEKVRLLRVLKQHPEILEEDVNFLLIAVEIINNQPVGDGHTSTPTSLELAYGLTILKQLFGYDYETSYDARKVCEYLLKEEGWPGTGGFFKFLKDFKSTANVFETSKLLEDKIKAVDLYLHYMTNEV